MGDAAINPEDPSKFPRGSGRLDVSKPGAVPTDTKMGSRNSPCFHQPVGDFDAGHRVSSLLCLQMHALASGGPPKPSLVPGNDPPCPQTR